MQKQIKGLYKIDNRVGHPCLSANHVRPCLEVKRRSFISQSCAPLLRGQEEVVYQPIMCALA